MRVLVVKSDFQSYQKGSVISDEKAIADILAGPNQVHVVASEHAEMAVEAPAQEPKE